MPNVMAALLNIGGALCWMLQRWADTQYWSTVQVERAAELQQCHCTKCICSRYTGYMPTWSIIAVRSDVQIIDVCLTTLSRVKKWQLGSSRRRRERGVVGPQHFQFWSTNIICSQSIKWSVDLVVSGIPGSGTRRGTKLHETVCRT